MAGSTHTVSNQPEPLTGYDVYGTDRALTEAVERHLDPDLLDEARAGLSALGRSAGSAQLQEWAAQANEVPPRLRTYDRYGHRIDEVEFHPAWHRLLGKGVAAGLTSAWGAAGRACAAGGGVPGVDAGGGGHLLPAVDDARGGAGAARRAGPRRRVGAPAGVADLRP
ncbi:hypothetical protein GCM10020256_13800 [Streptomyces thermocoprophilus]